MGKQPENPSQNPLNDPEPPYDQDFIDNEMLDEEDTDEDMPGDECGRWRNGTLGRACMKAGSEECDWICPYGSAAQMRAKKR